MELTKIAEKEGGYALADAGVTRIDQRDIDATILHFSSISSIPVTQLHPIGATGKTQTNGDIDLTVDVSLNPMITTHTNLLSELGTEHSTLNKGTCVASYAVPIRGVASNGLVQVDLMFTSNVNLTKFTYYSAGDQSSYKGSIRTILLQAVASAANEPGVDYFKYDTDGSLLIRAGRTLDLNVGLRRIFQHRPMKRNGSGPVKTLKTIPFAEFQTHFPNIDVNNRQIVVEDPDRIVHVLFDESVDQRDVQTAEQVIELIKQKFNNDVQAKIFKIAKSRVQGMIGRVQIPIELS